MLVRCLVKQRIPLLAHGRCLSTTTTLRNRLQVENLLILGSGLMGSGIAQVSAASSKFKSVVLQDVSQSQLDKAKAGMESSLLRIKKKDREFY